MRSNSDITQCSSVRSQRSIALSIVTSPSAAAPAASAPTISGCPLLPPDDIWNARVDTLPVHTLSSSYISSIALFSAFLGALAPKALFITIFRGLASHTVRMRFPAWY